MLLNSQKSWKALQLEMKNVLKECCCCFTVYKCQVCSFHRGREAKPYGCSAREASCKTQCCTAMAGNLQSRASGHGEMETKDSDKNLVISVFLRVQGFFTYFLSGQKWVDFVLFFLSSLNFLFRTKISIICSLCCVLSTLYCVNQLDCVLTEHTLKQYLILFSSLMFKYLNLLKSLTSSNKLPIRLLLSCWTSW